MKICVLFAFSVVSIARKIATGYIRGLSGVPETPSRYYFSIGLFKTIIL